MAPKAKVAFFDIGHGRSQPLNGQAFRTMHFENIDYAAADKWQCDNDDAALIVMEPFCDIFYRNFFHSLLQWRLSWRSGIFIRLLCLGLRCRCPHPLQLLGNIKQRLRRLPSRHRRVHPLYSPKHSSQFLILHYWNWSLFFDVFQSCDIACTCTSSLKHPTCLSFLLPQTKVWNNNISSWHQQPLEQNDTKNNFFNTDTNSLTGDAGPASVCSPATCKNCLAVGASGGSIQVWVESNKRQCLVLCVRKTTSECHLVAFVEVFIPAAKDVYRARLT